LATPIDAFQSWRRELEAVEQEMDRLIAVGLPASAEDRQVRQTRFVALVERREAAARKLLQSDWASRRDKSPRASSRPDAHPNSAAQGGAEALPDGGDQAETGSGLATSAFPTVATDAAVLPFVSAAVLSASAPADTAARPTDVVALAPAPAGLPTRSASAAPLYVGAPADSGELPTDVVAYAVASIAVSEADISPTRVDATTNDMFATPDVAEATPFARSSALSAATTGPVESADPVDTASHAGPASLDDDPSLMTLLRRLLRGGRTT
jgi:hypothetical protein